MLIYICDDSRADQLRLVHNIESYAKEKGAAVTVKLFSSADALLREYETSTEKPAVIFLDNLHGRHQRHGRRRKAH